MTGAARQILIATTNAGKLREITAILERAPVHLVTLHRYPTLPEPEETGTTFEENARLKALYYAEATGLVSIADDSGIEIEALDQAPGVHSARWHGSDYGAKFQKIYELLRARGAATSRARFVCRVAVSRRQEIVFEAEGVIEGVIADQPRGQNGFGYDPIFFYPPLGRTLAELDAEEKSAVSHRGQAFAAFRSHLLAHPALVG
ncbi:MAG: RdgB/HAM1 family non-canonical purine NTP pyrophosphatase [Acidobacteriota bacterium]|nr:RdgB/HAM1 family non-canonical purine NTP pyrophosphatase [Acidobacteriota bacterium]